MLLQLLYIFILNVTLLAASENDQSQHIYRDDEKHKVLQKILNNIKPTVTNVTYIDRGENLLKIPTLPRNHDEYRNKKKTIKKSPKRTIQKIIKRNKAKKRFYVNQVSSTTNSPVNDELDNYPQDELPQKIENVTTIHMNQKKKYKWSRISRYPMPFQKLQPMKEHKRSRRSNERKDLYIITDFDEMQFLDNDIDKGRDVAVNAHVKKYWKL